MRLVKFLLLLAYTYQCAAEPPELETLQSLSPSVGASNKNDNRIVLKLRSDEARRQFLHEHNASFAKLASLIGDFYKLPVPPHVRLSESTALLLQDSVQRNEVQQMLEEIDVLFNKATTQIGNTNGSVQSVENEAEASAELRNRLALFAAIGAKCNNCHNRYTAVQR